MDKPSDERNINTTTTSLDTEQKIQYTDSIDTGAEALTSNDKEAETTTTEPSTPFVFASPSPSVSATPPSSSSVPSSRRFLAAYITSILSGLSLLASGAFLGYSLFNHFLAPEDTSTWSLYFDLSPLYLATITSMAIFGTLYLLTSQYVARQVARDTVGVKDWRVYRVVYASFTAVLLILAASVTGSLLYIPLAIALVVQDFAPHEVWIQVLGGLHALLWIGVLIWQERLVKHGKKVALQGVVAVVLALVVMMLASIFLVINKTDERYDKRASSDLETIASTITTYKTNNAGKLPASLAALDFASTPLVEKRLDNYTYSLKQPQSDDSQEVRERAQQLSMFGQEDAADVSGGASLNMLELNMMSPRSQTMRESYELCATFRTDTTEATDSPFGALAGLRSAQSSFYKHGTGEVCFDRD